MMSLAAGLFGLIVGSFLNVVILRKGVRDIGGRSACPHCRHQLAWYDLVPVLSWVLLAGRCRYCASRISWQYPAVEAATGSAFALISGAPFPVGPGYILLFFAIAAVLICIAVYDLRHTIIPDAWAYTFAGLALVTMPHLLALPGTPVWPLLLAGPIASLPLFALWAISRGRWMGFGDVKLALGIGWLVGPLSGVFTVFLAFVLGSIALVPVIALQHAVTHMAGAHSARAGLTMRSEVPFGPFLILSTFIVWISLLYGYDIPALVWGI